MNAMEKSVSEQTFELSERMRRRGRPPSNAPHTIDEGVILGSAFTEFAERGYEGTTVRELARKLGVSHNLLNVRYGRKSELWKAAVDWRLAQAAKNVEPAFVGVGPPDQRLCDLIERFCYWATSHPDIVAIAFHEGQHASWRLNYLANQFILPFRARLDALIEEVRLVRTVSPVTSGALLSLLVHGVGAFFALRPLQVLLEGRTSERQHKHQASQLSQLIIAGLLP